MLETIVMVVAIAILALVAVGGMITIITGITEALAERAHVHSHGHGRMALHH